jgi:dipeptidyl aminopeptidase/acylaminoacyl peptidase
MAVRYWTSRGWTVADVNYRGSTGYGRRYRDQLHEGWGVVDVADCVAVAQWLADAGRVDADRMVIRGGSAGGFTTLAALCDSDVFAAGTSLYGIADLELLTAETHRFESGYNDWLVGALPEHADRYVDRSPIHHIDRLDRPLLVLHGAQDAVVPPSQAELVVGALRSAGVPVGYLLFDGEQHGFRRAETLERALVAEAYFLASVLDLPGGHESPPGYGGPWPPVDIENLPVN